MKTTYIGHYKNRINTYCHRECDFDNIDDCLNYVMKVLFSELGNGGMCAVRDGENKEGSLWRCADQIYDMLRDGLHYVYADGEWWIETVIEQPKIHTYNFRFSTVLDTNVNMSGLTYEDAKKRANEWARIQMETLKKTLEIEHSEWDCDDSANDEGETELT